MTTTFSVLRFWKIVIVSLIQRSKVFRPTWHVSVRIPFVPSLLNELYSYIFLHCPFDDVVREYSLWSQSTSSEDKISTVWLMTLLSLLFSTSKSSCNSKFHVLLTNFTQVDANILHLEVMSSLNWILLKFIMMWYVDGVRYSTFALFFIHLLVITFKSIMF